MRRYLLLFATAVFLLGGCTKAPTEEPAKSDKAALSFKPSFNYVLYNAVKGDIKFTKSERYAKATKASGEMAFADGDRVGVYLIKKGQALKPTFNAMDNRLFEYASASDALLGVPSTVFYPDQTTPVTTYAYYPYQNDITTAHAVGFKVSQDTKASDLCYATLPETAPDPAPRAMEFSHSLSKLIVEVDLSRNDRVEKLIDVTLIDVLDSCYLNLTNGSVTTSTTHSSTMTQLAGAYFILPAQALHSGRLIRLTCKMVDGTIAQFNYEPAISPLTLVQAKRHTITLFVNDNNSVELANNQSIAPWVENADQGTVQAPADNDFTIHWQLPSPRYADVASATLSVRDYRNGYSTPYTVSSITALPGNNNLLSSFAFNLSGYEDLHYPYTIESITFSDASGMVIQTCKALKANVIYRGGSITVGLMQDYILEITQASITTWGEGTVEGDAIYEGPVTSNLFSITYCNGAATATTSCLTIDKMVLTINEKEVTFSGLTMAGDQFAATSNQVDITAAAGVKPAFYPYFFTKVVLYRGAAVVETITLTKAESIEVTRSGRVAIEIMK